jgi:hypothetical protein
MDSCTWDPDTGTLATLHEAKEYTNLVELEQASWYKDAFADIGRASKGSLKPPPESLFNLDEDRLIKTIHQRNEGKLPSRATAPQPASKKLTSEIIQLTSLDEESTSSSSTEGSCSDVTDGVKDSPASSAEDLGNTSGTTDGG